MPTALAPITQPRAHDSVEAFDPHPLERRTPPWFIGDWTDMLFVHFSLPPAVLSPHVPFKLDVHDGRAWVSLVLFQLRRMRPRILGEVGRWLFRPMSDHWFLNLRTYVRGPAGPGIHFLREWIPNRLARCVGPVTYGLPYRHARFAVHSDLRRDHTVATITGSATGTVVQIDASVTGNAVTCAPGSTEEFLLERYIAYTHRRGRGRYSSVAHTPWKVAPARCVIPDMSLVTESFPFLTTATFHSAHATPGVHDVAMGPPTLLPVVQTEGGRA